MTVLLQKLRTLAQNPFEENLFLVHFILGLMSIPTYVNNEQSFILHYFLLEPNESPALRGASLLSTLVDLANEIRGRLAPLGGEAEMLLRRRKSQLAGEGHIKWTIVGGCQGLDNALEAAAEKAEEDEVEDKERNRLIDVIMAHINDRRRYCWKSSSKKRVPWCRPRICLTASRCPLFVRTWSARSGWRS